MTVNQNPDSAKSDVMCRLVTYKGFLLGRGDVQFCERLFLGRRDTKMSTYPENKSSDRPQYQLHQGLSEQWVLFGLLRGTGMTQNSYIPRNKASKGRLLTKNHIPGALCTAGRNNLLPQLLFSAPITLGQFPVNFGNVQSVYSWVSWAHPPPFWRGCVNSEERANSTLLKPWFLLSCGTLTGLITKLAIF